MALALALAAAAASQPSRPCRLRRRAPLHWARLPLQVGFELEFVLLQGGGAGIVPAGTRPVLPPPVDQSVYCQSSSFNSLAPGALGSASASVCRLCAASMPPPHRCLVCPPLNPLLPPAVLDDMCAALSSMGLRVEQLHPESAPGQFELALAHGPAMAAADGVLLAKEAVAAVAAKHGLVASFLPKLFAAAAGNGMHAHFSLWRGEANLLEHDPAALLAAGERALACSPRAACVSEDCHSQMHAPRLLARPTGPPSLLSGGAVVADGKDGASLAANGAAAPAGGLSAEGAAFMAGVLHHLPVLLCFTTPSPNSYRRLQPHCWSGAFQVGARACCRPCPSPAAPQPPPRPRSHPRLAARAAPGLGMESFPASYTRDLKAAVASAGKIDPTGCPELPF